ncbi:hypothetical protein RAZWK3B_19906 [Roseobacter sp. AzwK-3b]|jgi:hypothetical protein|uniref:hypothetical protein n=1 Tax=Roseobacter sp. AzwK-3b TaxID=351016 RepID=UPI0001569382|nr:hypothetical protein [Roseobacter sp. AzwK-3b]EDM71652.1 hypothetical protein RAZWK3B_19906 [Roseobacter sp. AzwK-3b]
MRAGTLVFLAFAALLSAGCTQLPALDDAIDPALRDAPYPQLVPIETLRASAPAPDLGDEDRSEIDARTATLRARAATLRGAVIDPDTRDRMARGVQER